MAPKLKISCDIFMEVTPALHIGLLAYTSIKDMSQSFMDCVESIFGATRQNSPTDLDAKLQETGSNRF